MEILVPDLLVTVVPHYVTSQYSHEYNSHDDGNQSEVACDIEADKHYSSNSADGNHCPSNNNYQMLEKPF
jgi:hypothetical protein